MSINIVANRQGWEPSQRKVAHHLAEMKGKGLRTDWHYCLALETHALMFAESNDVGTYDVSLVAYKGQYLTEDEYLALPLELRGRTRRERKGER